jgi:hypothetical protein
MKKKPDDLILEARERFKESSDAEDANRKAAVYDEWMESTTDQWTDEEKAQRSGRPCPTINKLQGTCKTIIGDARQNRPRIKVRPEDSESDPIIATILTGLIRNIENISDAEAAYDNGHENAVRGGWGYWRVLTAYSDYSSFDQDILIERIVNKYAVYFDQEAIKTDYSDARYCFVAEEMSRKRFEKEYPKAGSADWESGEGETASGWFSSDTVRIAEYWYKEKAKRHIFELADRKVVTVEKPEIVQKPSNGQPGVVRDQQGNEMQFTRYRVSDCDEVWWCKITGNEILDGPTKWPGKYIPIIPCLGEEVWIEGERILRSAIRYSTEPQKIYNWSQANNMETMALAPKQPWILSVEQIGPYKALWDDAYKTPRPYLPYVPQPDQPPPQRLTGSTADSGAMASAMQASDDIKATSGIYDASLGARGNETSGKAINARKQQGDTATFVFSDNQVRAVKYTGRILVDLITKIYDGERVIRLMGDDLKKEFAGKQQQMMPGSIKIAEDGLSAWARINIKFTNPVTGEEKIYNDLSVGKFDIVVDAGPGYNTKRQEATDGMIMLGQAAPQVMPVLIPRIAKAQDWPDAQEIGDEIKALSQPPPPPQPGPKDMLDLEKGKLDLQGKAMDLDSKQADNMIKAQQMQMQGRDQMELMYKIAQKAVFDALNQLRVQ